MDLIRTGKHNINYTNNNNHDNIVQDKIHYNENNKFIMSIYNQFHKRYFNNDL